MAPFLLPETVLLLGLYFRYWDWTFGTPLFSRGDITTTHVNLYAERRRLCAKQNIFFLSRLLYPGRTKVPISDAMQPSPATENRIWSFSSFFTHQSGGRPLLEPMRHPSPPLLDAACRPAFGRCSAVQQERPYVLGGYFRPGKKGGAQVAWIRNLGTTCCSQFDSNI